MRVGMCKGTNKIGDGRQLNVGRGNEFVTLGIHFMVHARLIYRLRKFRVQ